MLLGHTLSLSENKEGVKAHCQEFGADVRSILSSMFNVISGTSPCVRSPNVN